MLEGDSDFAEQFVEAFYSKVVVPEEKVAKMVASVLVNRGQNLHLQRRREEALAVYRDVTTRFGDRPETSVSEQVAKALINEGEIFCELGRRGDALSVNEQVVARYKERPEPGFRKYVAVALYNKANIMCGVPLTAPAPAAFSGDSLPLNPIEEALTLFDEVVAWYDDYPATDLASLAAAALVNQGSIFNALGRYDKALSPFNEVVARFGDSDDPDLAFKVGTALLNKCMSLGALGLHDEETRMCDEIASRYGNRVEPWSTEIVACALVYKGMGLIARERLENAFVVCDDVVVRFGERQEPALVRQVARAVGNKGWTLYLAGRYEDSVEHTLAALDRDPTATVFRCNLALALLHLGDIDTARETYAAAARELATVEDLDQWALHDLDVALSQRPDLPGAEEVREMLLERRLAVEKSAK